MPMRRYSRHVSDRFAAAVRGRGYLREMELRGTVEVVPLLSHVTAAVPAFGSMALTRPSSPVAFLRTWPGGSAVDRTCRGFVSPAARTGESAAGLRSGARIGAF